MFGHHHSPTATYGGASPESENEEIFRQKVRRALADPNRRYYGAHVVGHGGLNVPALFARAAKESGMIRICNAVGNFNPVDELRNELLDWNAAIGLVEDPDKPLTHTQKERLAVARVPAGFLKGGRGTTRIWKQYWQIGSRPGLWPFKGKPEYDRQKKTYVEVKIVTWFFSDIGDYETRFEMNIVSVPVWKPFLRAHRVGPFGIPVYDEPVDPTQPQGRWYWKRLPWTEHQKACDKIIASLFDDLKKAPPCQQAKDRRIAIAQARRAARQRGEVGAGADIDNLFGDSCEATQTGASSSEASGGAKKLAEAVPAVASDLPKPTGKTVAVEVELIPPSAMKRPRED